MSLHSPEVQKSLKKFQDHYDAMANGGTDYFNHHVERLVTFLERDLVVQSVLKPMLAGTDISIAYAWLKSHNERRGFQRGLWHFPENQLDELVLRFYLLKYEVSGKDNSFVDLLFKNRTKILSYEAADLFTTVIAKPFYLDLCELMENPSNIRSQDTQTLLALPETVPAENETRIFLSHKSEDKELVRRYHKVLAELGYKPWLDESDMPAGTHLDRGLFAGIDESCAIVFFLTENFRDENILAEEIEYSIQRERERKRRFSIITLRFSDNVVVPTLLKTRIWINVQYELGGLYEIVRALPVELGPVRWKEGVVE